MPVHVCHQVDVGLTPLFFFKTYIPEGDEENRKGVGVVEGQCTPVHKRWQSRTIGRPANTVTAGGLKVGGYPYLRTSPVETSSIVPER